MASVTDEILSDIGYRNDIEPISRRKVLQYLAEK